MGGRPEIYVSVDIESDGPIPGPHSMLSFGAVAFRADGEEVGAFEANLLPLPDAAPHPKTMAWWETQPEAWTACHRDPVEPAVAMADFHAFVLALPGKPVFVGYPASFDFLFVHWYLQRFVGETAFSHSALDMKTLAMVLLGVNYREVTKKHFPSRWKTETQHTHVAIDDAREQGEMFVKMLAEARSRIPPKR